MSLVGIRLELSSNQPILLLREEAPRQRYLPISIGPAEAFAIIGPLQGKEPPRPMTHDLFRNLLEELDIRLDRIVITELRDATFYAELDLLEGDSHHQLSSRPSDAIALAVRYGEPVPIFADEAVLEAAGALVESDEDEEEGQDKDEEIQRFREFLDHLNPEDFES